MNTAFGEPTMAVDTHIFRVANRTGLAPGKTVRIVEDKLLKFVPAEFLEGRPSLADPARPLRVHRAQSRLSALHHRGSLRVSPQNQGAGAVTFDTPPASAPPGGYTREQLRQSYVDAWRKYLARSPLTPLESLITDVIALHPEYHSVVADPANALRHESAGRGSPGESFFTYGAASSRSANKLQSTGRPGSANSTRRSQHTSATRTARTMRSWRLWQRRSGKRSAAASARREPLSGSRAR